MDKKGQNFDDRNEGKVSKSSLINQSVSSDYSYIRILGSIAIKNGFIKKELFESVFNEYKNSRLSDPGISIEDMLLNRGVVSHENMSKLIASTLRILDKEFCSSGMKLGLISEEDARKALSIQKVLYSEGQLKPVSDILHEQKMISAGDINKVFAHLNHVDMNHSQGVPANNINKESDNSKSLDTKLNSHKENGYKPLRSIWKEKDKKPEESIKNIALPAKNLRLGRLAIKKGVIKQEVFDLAVQEWSGLISTGKSDSDFLQYMVNQNLITKEALDELILQYDFGLLLDLDKTFCKLAVFYKFINESVSEEVLEDQKKIFLKTNKLIPAADILFKKNLITRKQAYQVLMEQQRDKLASKYYEEIKLTEKEKVKRKAVEKEKIKSPVSSRNINIEVSEDALSATLKLGDYACSAEDVINALKEKGVVYGIINKDVIQTFLDEEISPSLVVARGKAPRQPVHSEIKCHFKKNYLNVGTLSDDGTIDYMERGEIPFVETEVLLAEKIPPVEGRSGMDIFGTEIPVEKAIDIKIDAGPGTKLDSSGMKIYSAEKGQPHISVNGKVSILNVHEIKGDVDFKTGHINFKGNVVVRGGIKPGFKVTATNVTVEEVTDGEIDAKGFVEVKSGISGGKINAEGGLHVKFTANTEITAFGDVTVDKEIIDSTIKTSGVVSIPTGKIISSLISGKRGVEVKQVGTDVSAPSVVEIGKSSYLENLLNPLLEAKEELDKSIKKEEHILAVKETDQQKSHSMIADKAQIQDKANQALSKLNDLYDKASLKSDESLIKGIRVKKEELEKNIVRLDKEVKALFDLQDSLIDEIVEHRKILSDAVSEREKLQAEIENIRAFDHKVEASPVLIVHSTLEKDTKVVGPNSVWKVQETSKNIKITEVRVKDEDENYIHVLRASRLK